MPVQFHEVRVEALSATQQAALSAAVGGRLARGASGAWDAGGFAVHPSVVEAFERSGWITVTADAARATPEGVRRLALSRGIVPTGMQLSVADCPPRVLAHWKDGDGRTVTVATMASVRDCREAMRSMLDRLGGAAV